MSEATTPSDTNLELVLTREIPVSPEKLFRTWHTRLAEWFAPKPLTTPEVEMDFRTGGVLRTLMRDPDGNEYPTMGVFLEIVENSRIVMTDAYKPGWVPNPELFFTAYITFEALPNGNTQYTARARHWTEENCKKHVEMGFHEGWGQCLDQLQELAMQG